ncbi:DUF2807 domain-containing protein [Gluconacetobacter azotocaptans]|uniref:DUF2807 domain-containing protein n=1 Tax=Gluconacetobacter azotocaptans TaxID=142834 RepID=A0A7W4JUA0_9PROT|nr:DUF2807 domain-containing protein [Gluconacetobacter azotocaptans]MBB2190959.1 DUF2807 domain-containing protein [Gluconacetobacter azotocaptans]MBM9401684.1 DUF2807 domain-containing protein [Gluconacetobacter azotocaptans]GBQ31859.1 hypothetical protein AA13594_2213 [Gluconacetobacter azotocaptans DSM 13594]
MIRGIALVAVGGAALSVACFSVAAVRGPMNWHFPDMIWTDDDDDAGKGAPSATRAIPWAGAENLTFAVPATIVYTQGPAAGITVSGPGKLVDRVSLQDNTLDMDDNGHHHHWHSGRLRIVVTAPALKAITVRSAGKLTLQDLAVDHLKLTVEGAADVVGHGRADKISLSVAGAANADLSDMIVTDADIDIQGAGHVSVGPTGHAGVHLSGVGAVELTRRPASLTKEIEGIGTVSVPDEPKGTRL